MFREVQTRRGGAAHEGEESDTPGDDGHACEQMKQDFQSKLQEQERKFEEKNEELEIEFEDKIAEQKEKVQQQQQKIKEQDQKIGDIFFKPHTQHFISFI